MKASSQDEDEEGGERDKTNREPGDRARARASNVQGYGRGSGTAGTGSGSDEQVGRERARTETVSPGYRAALGEVIPTQQATWLKLLRDKNELDRQAHEAKRAIELNGTFRINHDWERKVRRGGRRS